MTNHYLEKLLSFCILTGMNCSLTKQARGVFVFVFVGVGIVYICCVDVSDRQYFDMSLQEMKVSLRSALCNICQHI